MKKTSRRSKAAAPQTRHEDPDRSDCCEACAKPIAGFESTSVGDGYGHYRTLCNRCCNEEFARSRGLDFTHVDFEPLVLKDAAGAHRFFFETRLLGDRVAINALEVNGGRPRGYEFQVLGPSDTDPFELMSQMVARIRRTLAREHLRQDKDFGLCG